MSQLFEAVASGDMETARSLAAAQPELREARDADGLLPATRALYSLDRQFAEDLLPPDASLGLCEAAAFGRLPRMHELLREDPARVNELSTDGFTPLQLACFSGGPAVTEALIRRGADLERRSENRFARVRPLGTAVFSGDRESARLLLEAGADPNGQGEGGFTPLHSAAMNGDADLVRLLLSSGADAGLPLPDGRTAEHVAREGGHGECARLLASEGAHTD